MNYFVESVNVYSTTGKSRKGAALQNVAKQYEHRVLDDTSLSALIASLRILVDVCNKSFPGKPLQLSASTDSVNGGGHISVSDGGATCVDVFSISYAPMYEKLYFSHIRAGIYDALKNGVDDDLARNFIMACNEDSNRKGGVK